MLSEKLKRFRANNNLTQEEFAAKLFVTRNAVSKWENDNCYPNIDTLKDIAKFFNVTIDELLGDDDLSQQTLEIYAGILFNNQTFIQGNNDEIIYNFNCPEFITLKEKYNLEKIAGKGTDFIRAKRLLHYLAPRLTHSSWYDNHVPCNALDLLEYSLNNKEQGINCLNKSKILQECCLAIGIYARRVRIMPYSPFDFDNHVVTEIFDRELNKWIMLDPTTDGLFIDENKTPLSLLEIRKKFANDEFVTFVHSDENLQDLNKIKDKYIDENAYICKNLFYFYIDKDATFVTTGNVLAFVPINYSVKNKDIANAKYRINHLPKEYKEWKCDLEKRIENLINYPEIERTNINSMIKSPL